MSVTIIPFPSLNNNLLKRIGFCAEEYKAYYMHNGIRCDLKVESEDENNRTYSSIKLSDDNCQWHPETHKFSLERKFNIRNPKFLFGENGLASEKSSLGIAVRWFSKDSNQRGVVDCGNFDYGSIIPEFNLCLHIEKGQLRGVVFLETIIYLKFNASPNDKFYARKEGTVLGTIDESRLSIDGTGSIFPVVEVDEPGKPLWYLRFNWMDPLEDSFSEENVLLCINKSNPRYELLKMDEGLKSSPYLTEIIACAMQTIVTKVMEAESWEEIFQGKNLVPGSIGQAVNYFISTFNWDVSSPERLALTIRKDLESRI